MLSHFVVSFGMPGQGHGELGHADDPGSAHRITCWKRQYSDSFFPKIMTFLPVLDGSSRTAFI